MLFSTIGFFYLLDIIVGIECIDLEKFLRFVRKFCHWALNSKSDESLLSFKVLKEDNINKGVSIFLAKKQYLKNFAFKMLFNFNFNDLVVKNFSFNSKHYLLSAEQVSKKGEN